MSNIFELLRQQAVSTNAAKVSVKMFPEEGGYYEIVYHAPNDCRGYGHK